VTTNDKTARYNGYIHCSNVLAVQLPAYRVEAELIGFVEIPALKDTVTTLQASKEMFYGFYIGEVLAGVISVQMVEDTLDIHRLVVHPTYFRQGIGKALLQYILDKNRDRVGRYIVWTGANNTPAKRLYSSFGFHELEQMEVDASVSLVKLERGTP
jgi:ribosomal protein S18 acetylase RimI-like enzyme